MALVINLNSKPPRTAQDQATSAIAPTCAGAGAGDKTMANTEAGYISYRGIVKSCHVAKTGNIISDEYGMGLLYRADSRHPAIRNTRDEAQVDAARFWAQTAAREAKCAHDWFPLSHEEEHCSRCGAVRVVPDLPDVPASDRMASYRSQLRAQAGS